MRHATQKDGSEVVCQARETESCHEKRRPLEPKEAAQSAHSLQALPGVAKHMMNSNVKFPLGPKNKDTTTVGQGNVLSSMGDTQDNTSGVFRVIQNANTFTTGNRRINPSDAFSKTSELSCVVAAQGST